MRKRNSPGLLKRILIGLNSFVALMLLLSYLAYYIPPSPGWVFGFLGLAYPALLITNGLFILVWISFRSKYIIISIFAISIGWNHIDRHYGFGSDNDHSQQSGLKIITYNIKTNRYSPHKEEVLSQISNYINREAPEIMCLQECFLTSSKFHTFSEATSEYWSRQNNMKGPVQGLYTFSKLPIAGRGIIQKGDSKFALFHDLIHEGDTVRIYNIQLASIRLQKEKELFDQKRDWQSKKSKEQIFSMFHKLNDAYSQRTEEVRVLKKHMRKCRYPLIICGDFNDTPLSYTYRSLSDGLSDPFNEFGKGFGNTHNENLPPIRIDYILHDKSLETTWYEIDTPSFSDHFPVIAFTEKEN